MTSAVLLGLAFVALLVIALGLGIAAHRLPGRRTRRRDHRRALAAPRSSWPAACATGSRSPAEPRVIGAALACSAVAWAASTGTFLAAGQAVGVQLTVAQARAADERRRARLDRPVGARLRRHVRADRGGHRRRLRDPARTRRSPWACSSTSMILATTSVGGVIAILAFRRRRAAAAGATPAAV